MLTDGWLISWQSRDSGGWSDVLQADWLVPRPVLYRVEHLIVGRDGHVLRAVCDISSTEGNLILFSYGGHHAAQNREVGVGVGDMRIDPSSLSTATHISWKWENEGAFRDYPVNVKRLRQPEGKRRAHVASRVRRSSMLAMLKVAIASEQEGHLRCEACHFAGLDAYGDARPNCFEVHHRKPLRTGERESSLDDLAVLCANCHRVYHSLGEPPPIDFFASFGRD